MDAFSPTMMMHRSRHLLPTPTFCEQQKEEEEEAIIVVVVIIEKTTIKATIPFEEKALLGTLRASSKENE